MRTLILLAVLFTDGGSAAQSAPPVGSGTWQLDTSGANARVWPLCGTTCDIRIEAHAVVILRGNQRATYPTDGSSRPETIDGPYGATTLLRSGSWQGATLTLTTRVGPDEGGSTATLAWQTDILTVTTTIAGSGRGSTTTARYRRK